MSSHLTEEFLLLYRALPQSIREQARQAYQLDDLFWFWIGSHSEYDHLLKQI